MKVLHFYKTYLPTTIGGVENVINQIARGTQEFGIQMEVLSLSKNKDLSTLEIDGHLAHRAKLDFEIASTGFSFSAFSRFSELAKKADVIHYHFPWPFMDLIHFITRFKKPTVVTYHSDIIQQKYLLKLYRPLQNWFLNSVDKIVATSPNYLETSEVLKKFPQKIQVIPIGLDNVIYSGLNRERYAYWNNKFGNKFFLFIGIFRYYKGLHVLLEAARNLPYPIVLAGEGPIEDTLKAQVSKLNLKNVHFVGRVSNEDKTALLNLCYGFVFPSHLRSEAFGVSLLEAAMFGKPMISCEIGTGTSFINIDGKTGLVTPPNDAIKFQNAMKWLWEHPEEGLEMGQNAKKRYDSHFTSAQMSEAYANLYKELGRTL